MVELSNDVLVFSFPEEHARAKLRIEFQRTLRIPDDGATYPLPPGLGRFPVRHVDDHAQRVPDSWMRHGGVMLPMYQSEALWLAFASPHGYPFAVKIGTGKIDALTGEAWESGLHASPQDYLVVPGQPWLDGYVVGEGVIRQFVAMPLGEGYTAEEQFTGAAQHGGLQILVYPISRAAYERISRRRHEYPVGLVAEGPAVFADALDMGLAPGGTMKQAIYRDEFELSDWATSRSSRVFVHLANSVAWLQVTGERPPTRPPTAADYTKAGLPWFDYYDADRRAIEGAEKLAGLESVAQRGTTKRTSPLPENESVVLQNVVELGTRKAVVREGEF